MKISTILILFPAFLGYVSAQETPDPSTFGTCYTSSNCEGMANPPTEVTLGDCFCLCGASFEYEDEDGGTHCASFGNSHQVSNQRALQTSNSKRLLAPQNERRLPPVLFWVVVILVCSATDLNRARSLQEQSCFSVEDYQLQCNGNMCGEPHIKQLLGGYFDYHGECDLVFSESPAFDDGKGLTIHARTKVRYDYSYIKSAAVRIGSDILEVSGYGNHALNGVIDVQLTSDTTIGGHQVIYEQINEKQHVFEIDLGDDNAVVVDAMKDIVSIRIKAGGDRYGPKMREWFGESTGLLGSLSSGKMLARNGTVLEDPNAMGQEWQVLPHEPKLFMVPDRAPQYPNKCILPDPAAKEERRRLGGTSVSLEAAEMACKDRITSGEKDTCIYDVMATGDLDMALAGVF